MTGNNTPLVNALPAVITWWEADQLVDYIASKPDMYTQGNGASVWVHRSLGLPCFALGLNEPQFVPELGTQVHGIIVQPLGWPTEKCTNYVHWLLSSFTDFGYRSSVQHHLETHGGIQDARVLALQIAHIGHLLETRGIQDARVLALQIAHIGLLIKTEKQKLRPEEHPPNPSTLTIIPMADKSP